ncbi:unnamed protein product, partial [Mesorhabditis spiculigera]
MYSVEDWKSWCTEKYRCTRCHNNEKPVDDMLMKRREFENDTGRTLGEVELEVLRENVPRLIHCIKCYQKYHYFNNEPENTWIPLEEAFVLVHSNAIQQPEMSSVATMIELDFYEHQVSEAFVEMVDTMSEGKEVTVDEREKWVKKAIERKMIPAQFTSEVGFQLDIGRMMNILHSPIFRGVLSRTSGQLALGKSQEYPSEMAVYECAGAWKRLELWGAESRKDGINCSSFVIRSIQKLLNEGTSQGNGFYIHSGPWHFPFIGEKQKAFEEKYNVRVVLITYEGERSTIRSLCIFHCNKPNTRLFLYYKSNRYFDISIGSPSDIDKYEQMQLGIIAKDETRKVTSEKINESTYKRTVAPETQWNNARVWTANYRPTFDDINSLDYLKGPLPDMSYCREFDEMC